MIFHDDFHKVQDMILPFFFALKALPYWPCHGLSAAPQVEPLFTGWQRSTAVSSSGIELSWWMACAEFLVSAFDHVIGDHWGPNGPIHPHLKWSWMCHWSTFRLSALEIWSILSLSQGVNGEIWCFFHQHRIWDDHETRMAAHKILFLGRETKTNQGDQKPAEKTWMDTHKLKVEYMICLINPFNYSKLLIERDIYI